MSCPQFTIREEAAAVKESSFSKIQRTYTHPDVNLSKVQRKRKKTEGR